MDVIETLRSLDNKTLLAVHNDAAGKTSTRFASRSKGEEQTLRAIKKRCNGDAGISGIWLGEAIDRFHGAPAAALKTKPEANEAGKEADKGASEAVTGLIKIAHKTATVVETPAEPKVKKTRRSKGTNVTPYGGAPTSCREGTKRSIMLDMLCRPEGASVPELVVGLSGGKQAWLPQTVKAGFGWDMRQKGYGVKSQMVEGVERFFIVLPTDENGNPYPVAAHTPVAKKGS